MGTMLIKNGSSFPPPRLFPATHLFEREEYIWLRICLNNSWICLNIPDYVWTCQNMHEYAKICLNGFCFRFSLFPHFFYNPLSTWTHDYLFECLQETRGYSLKIHGAVFLKRQNLIFPVAAGSTWFVFFRLNIFTIKIETYCHLLVARGGVEWGLDWWLWIWIYLSSVLFFLSQKL